MTTAKQELDKVVKQLPEDKQRIILRFAEWLRDQESEFTEEELTILRKGEKQVNKGDFVWWRDVKRTSV
jgi:hypothetical protein